MRKHPRNGKLKFSRLPTDGAMEQMREHLVRPPRMEGSVHRFGITPKRKAPKGK